MQGEQKGNHELATEEDLSPGSFMQGILRELYFAFRRKNRQKKNIKKATTAQKQTVKIIIYVIYFTPLSLFEYRQCTKLFLSISIFSQMNLLISICPPAET